jgi:glycosyltransferase involved in cell wall biosynthesis
MRRLTVVQLLPALGSGGVERSTLEIAQALVRAGHRSIVVSAGGRLVDTLIAQGSEHIERDIGRKSLASLRHVLALRRLFRAVKPDIVHARSRLPAWLGWWALKGIAGSHFITTVHGLNSPGRYSSIMARGERVICVSESVRAHVLSQWPATDPGKLVVIERGIDPLAFPSTPLPAPDGEPVLLMPGRGTRLKGHHAALQLLADLRGRGVRAQLRLLGTREAGREAYVAELEASAAALGLAQQLQILAPTADMAGAYRDCNLVLQLSSRPEAFGRTVVEALCSGRPVVGWAHGGVADLLSRLFPEGRVARGDREGLRDTTLSLLASPRAISPIAAQTLAGMQAQTLKVYESVAA